MDLTGLTLDQKFARTVIKLRDIRPFFSAVYESIPHIETESVDTMAVNGKQLLYNRKFAESLEFSEFMYVILHEVCHIALMHVPRCEDRDPKLWNIAADLYSNKLLAEEFGFMPGEETKDKNVKFLKGALYCSSIELDTDTTEKIYEVFYRQAVINGYIRDKNNKNGNDAPIVMKKYHFEYEGSDKRVSDKYKKFELDIDSIEITLSGNSGNPLGGIGEDIKNDGTDPNELSGENKAILAEASIKYDMTYGGTAGTGSGILNKLVANLLKSYIDWRTLLRKYCIDIVSKDSSFRSPDKRMYYQKAIYPGSQSETEKVLERVKLCFDCSGSISEKDTQYFYGQAKALLKTFKVEAEVISWDTCIVSKGVMENPSLVKNAYIIRGGGTDPSCVFRYFDSKQCKIKPLVTVIFTDGWINFDDKPIWHKKYKNTIWVMTRNYNKTFEPPFGKIAIAKFND